jgi:hypothetical protein
MDNKSMIIEKLVERRKPERFRGQEGAFVELRDHHGKLGEIIDISKEGLTFRYIDIGDRPKGSFELDIFLKEKGHHGPALLERLLLISSLLFNGCSLKYARKNVACALCIVHLSKLLTQSPELSI